MVHAAVTLDCYSVDGLRLKNNKKRKIIGKHKTKEFIDLRKIIFLRKFESLTFQN